MKISDRPRDVISHVTSLFPSGASKRGCPQPLIYRENSDENKTLWSAATNTPHSDLTRRPPDRFSPHQLIRVS